MEEKRPQLDLRGACSVGGRPGSVHVSPDAGRLYVFDQDRPRISVVGIAGFEIFQQIDLAPFRVASRFVLGSSGSTLYCAAPGGRIALFSMLSHQFHGSIACQGVACDLGLGSGERQAVVTVADGKKGFVQVLDMPGFRTVAKLGLPLPPVEGGLALAPGKGLGAALVGSGGRAEAAAVWSLDPLAYLFTVPLPGGARSLAFDAEAQSLVVAGAAEPEVVVIDLEFRRVVQRIRMAGRPYQVAPETAGRNLWILCESLGHGVLLEPRQGAVSLRLTLPGLRAPLNRLAFSPDGKLAAVPEQTAGSVALVESHVRSPRYGTLADRLELGRSVTGAAWSPLGDEVFVCDEELGAVLALAVDRGDLETKDTDEYLVEQVKRETERRRAASKNPLFPP
jgi:DNA-binding beta-propeller fold protein YncE